MTTTDDYNHSGTLPTGQAVVRLNRHDHYIGRSGSAESIETYDRAIAERFVVPALLQKYVDDKGMVAYAKWKSYDADVKALDGYLVSLGCVKPTKAMTKEGQLAFWINAYYAVTIRGILRGTSRPASATTPRKRLITTSGRISSSWWTTGLCPLDRKHFPKLDEAAWVADSGVTVK
jgi:Protein of unknown function, DUF547